MYNEVIIKSWNQAADGPSGKCVSNDWTAKEKNAWGWSDALDKKPILAFAAMTGVRTDVIDKNNIKKLKKMLSGTAFADRAVGFNVVSPLGADPFYAI